MTKRDDAFARLPQVGIERPDHETEIVQITLTRRDAEVLTEILGNSDGPLLMLLFQRLRETLRFSSASILNDDQISEFFRWEQMGKREDPYLALE